MARLEIISGVVTELKLRQAAVDFAFAQIHPVEKAEIVSADLPNSAMLACASMDADMDTEFFTCTVNGITLFGRFHKVEFADGDAIDFVVEPKSDAAAVHAARSTSKRTLWTLPYQARGRNAQRRSDRKWSVILSCSAVVAVAISEYFTSTPNPQEPIIYEILFYLAVFGLVLFVNWMIRRRFREFALNATAVFNQLGYTEPTDVDLYVIHKRAQKKLQDEAGTLPALMQPWSFRY